MKIQNIKETVPVQSPGKRKILLLIITITFFQIQIFGQVFTKMNIPAITEKKANGFGCGIFDYDSDGKLDIYVTNSNTACTLFKNNGGDSFTELIVDNLVPKSISNYSGITVGDYDNDGNDDLFLLNMNGSNSLIKNDGNGKFTRMTDYTMKSLSGFLTHATWGDYDNDGLLDLFIPACGSSSFTKSGGIANYLFHNDGGGKFTKVTDSEPAKLSKNNVSANFCDFDNDGDLDLFMTECQADNHLYENKGGVFTEIEKGNFTNTLTSIACSWGDYNNDGYMDLFVANGMPTEGGNYPSYLYKNNGNKTFTKITSGEVADFRGNSWNGVWGDVNNDGYLDLFVGTYSQADVLFINNGDGTFKRNNEFDMSSKGTSGACFGDYNNDGFLDLFTPNAYGTGHLIYKNNTNSKNWLFVKCIGSVSNKSAIGAKVKIVVNVDGKQLWQVREVNSNMGFRSATELRTHFGLGNSTVVDSLIVEWPSKRKTIKTNVSVNQNIIINEETDSQGTDIKSDKSIHNGFSLEQNYPNPFNPSTVISYNLHEPGYVILKVYNTLGKEVATLVNEYKQPGVYNSQFPPVAGKLYSNINGQAQLPSGVYFYTLRAGDFIQTKKMLLIK